MKFTKLLSTVVAVVCSCLCCVNASDSIGNSLEICFTRDGNNGLSYNATYRDGRMSSSNTSCNISDLAKSINNISQGIMSIGSTDRECFNSDMGSYFVGSSNGGFSDLVVLNNTKCKGNLKNIVFSGDKKYPTSIQMNFNNASDMKLPAVNCKNMALLKFKVENDSANDVGSIASLTVDTPVGLFFNKPIKINGGIFKDANSNLNTLCLVANKVTFDYPKNGAKYRFGIKYDIPGITDKLAEKGLIIADIRVEKEAPNGAKVIGLRDVNGLINGGAGVFAADGCLNVAKMMRKPVERISNGGIGRIVCSGEHPLLDIREGFLKAENNFIVFTIS